MDKKEITSTEHRAWSMGRRVSRGIGNNEKLIMSNEKAQSIKHRTTGKVSKLYRIHLETTWNVKP